MSRPEIAVARSHINVWKRVAASNHEYALVLEDDVWFRPHFAKELDHAWGQLEPSGARTSSFDILYLSYEEVKHGAPKTFVSSNVFRPVRGLWHLSGYVISREGAEHLLRLLPCRGPVDLWLNHQFGVLDVRATRRSIISQRRDISSTNSYSILPALTRIGAITSESASLFHARPSERPVFGFGQCGSGLSSLAMALSMLGYRCCNDLKTIPARERESLLAGTNDRIFDAYVNIGSLGTEVLALRRRYPYAKFIITTRKTSNNGDDTSSTLIDALHGADVKLVPLDAVNKWQLVCEHLRCAPPSCSFPELVDRGQRPVLARAIDTDAPRECKTGKRDKSPWIIEQRAWWQGIRSAPIEDGQGIPAAPVSLIDRLDSLDEQRWLRRNDTFTENLALFRPSNLECRLGCGAALNVRREPLGVREYSAAALTSRDLYLFGRFEAIIMASSTPGVVTGMFLHRDSPRQEIDIEIAGNRTDRLLVNVFFNPGGEGARYDYGYRGAPSYVDLGFDASEAFHRFAIEWGPCEMRWFVDDHLVHTRREWEPTPIPHLPMAFDINVWPCRSKELAGRLASGPLQITTFVKSIELQANRHERSPAR
ncbi:MAG: family 16 glycosylhydrolase [Nitrospira sp.]|nr:family 16 glycosylhydrolase [Nitrospira sp.]